VLLSRVYYEELAPAARFRPKSFYDKDLPERIKAAARFAFADAARKQLGLEKVDGATEAFFKSGETITSNMVSSITEVLEGTAERTIRDQARNTLVHNAKQERGARWRRIPSADACPFCRMLSINGAIYKSETTALASHDWCKCEARVARPGGTVEVPDYMSSWRDDYEKARDAAHERGDHVNADSIVNAWNRQLRADAK
jgi:transcription elongation factor Elf1